MIGNLKAALQFLTIVPIGKTSGSIGPGMVACFPVAGLVIGGLLALLDAVLQHVFPLSIVSLIDIVFLVVITGALHLDGLADTADGLFSHRTSEDALRIMKDSRIGAMGVLAMVCVLAIKWAGIFHLHEYRWLYLVVIPAYARGAFTVAIYSLKYIRPEGGTAGQLFSGNMRITELAWLLVPVTISALMGLKGIILIGVFVGIIMLVNRYYKKKLGGITGDMLGALGEVTEAGLFLVAGTWV